MNSDLKRARNKRKRAKQRARKVAKREQTILRIRFHTNVVMCEFWKSPKHDFDRVPARSTVAKWAKECQVPFSSLWRTLDVDWLYTTQHSVNSNIHDYLTCLANTLHGSEYDCAVARISCEIQLHGLNERRRVWQGHAWDVDPAELVAEVCSFMSQIYSEELDSQESFQYPIL